MVIQFTSPQGPTGVGAIVQVAGVCGGYVETQKAYTSLTVQIGRRVVETQVGLVILTDPCSLILGFSVNTRRDKL